MSKGTSTPIIIILVLLVIISTILISYEWLLKYSPWSQWEIQKTLVKDEGCLKIENIDTINKKITIRNCGKTDLSNFIVYIDDEPIANYSETLGSGGIVQISYTGYISIGEHVILISSDYAEAPKIIFYIGCDIYIYLDMIPYLIDKSNTIYCLAENVHIDGQNAIKFTDNVQNSILDCQGYNLDSDYTISTYGVHLSGFSTKSNTVKNCNVTNFYYDIYLESSSNNILINNSIYYAHTGILLYFSSNNTLINNTAKSNNRGIYLSSSSNNTLTGCSILNNTYSGIIISSSSNNTLTGCSILNNTYDYYLALADTNNNFTNTNFTGPRRIYFADADSWFIYNNETTGNIWLKTNVSTPATITRKLTSWSQDLIQWNDTTIGDETARYNVSGLIPSTNYNVYNNSVPISGSPFNSGSEGKISFTINLPINEEHEIKVERA